MSCLIVCKKCNAVVVRGFDGSQADAGTTEYNVNGCKMHAKTVVLNSGKDSGVQGIFCWKCDGMLGLRFPENFPPVENVVLCDLDEPNMVVFAQNTSIVRRERRGPNPDAPVSTGFFAQVRDIQDGRIEALEERLADSENRFQEQEKLNKQLKEQLGKQGRLLESLSIMLLQRKGSDDSDSEESDSEEDSEVQEKGNAITAQ